MPDNEQTQQQSQTQTLNLTLNLGRNTGDPGFEEQVFSAGSQIGRMAALPEVLLNASRGKAALKSPGARDAIDAFERMQADIQKAKAERAPERAFVKQLDALQARDPEASSGLSLHCALACRAD
jgi:hypothetical protein